MNDPLQAALAGLSQVIEAPCAPGTQAGNWRWTVRQRLGLLRDGLSHETAIAHDGWAVAREGSVLRERYALMKRISELGPEVLHTPELEHVRHEVRRLLADVHHHRQRLHDVQWDEAEVDFGGSE